MTWQKISISTTVLFVLWPFFGVPAKTTSRLGPVAIDGCALLEKAADFNGKQVKVDGLVYADFEHFDLRFPCDGYIQLQTSRTKGDISKYGFKTVDNAEMEKLTVALNSSGLREHTGQRMRATVTGLFRCHFDFPDCKDISRYGDSSIVIRKVENVRLAE